MARVTQRYQQRQRWTMSQCRPGWSVGAGRSWSRPSKAQSCRCWPLAPALAEVHGQAEGRVRAGEDGRGEPGPAVWVGDRVELDDLALGDGEGDHGVGPPVHPQDGAGRTVDQGRVHLGGGLAPWSAWRATAAAPRVTADRRGRLGLKSAPTTTSGWSTATRASKSPARLAARKASPTARCRARSPLARGLGRLDAAAGSAGQLSGRLGGAPNQRRDLLAGQVEQIVEDEGEALGRGRGVDHDLQGEADPSATSSCCSGSGPPPGSGSDQGRSPPGTPRAGRCASAAG
jgi:hypothetical protein